ncbi:HNH endonuclease domain-containing protein [Oligosphaera ethanolica]|uniref:5-methylcytosine-specific restriction endonuclease McrA n=1 Tax=Oligosphaera ethanolica TaxID=760260 RepID=A0AAE3VCN6_9BACT|nr:HNH endonuclease domain-containing protein [Oligosphaera ethanolica]MDQ0288035.1 5-methylcytosine-specific restriction endonuclease McrA [Oligosphaera ethanolica]
MNHTRHFYEVSPTLENYWRAIILFGRNTASYKFALAKSLYHFKQANDLIRLDELAPVFSRYLVEHLKKYDKQCTVENSRFLDACRAFNNNELSQSQLIEQTVSLGFQNVIDAFHNVHGDEIPHRFFNDERKQNKGIRLTEDFYRLSESPMFTDLYNETESRWRLVETAWNLQLPAKVLSVQHDPDSQFLQVLSNSLERVPVTSARTALNGYQKGKCFYCFRDIMISNDQVNEVDVDHFFPHKLKYCAEGKAIDGVANLVLACKECNRGQAGKFDRLPAIELLERLHRRNEYLIQSHHPLRETLIAQTGFSEKARIDYLQAVYSCATVTIAAKWLPKACGVSTF